MITQNDWQTALSSSYEQLNNDLVLHVPQLIGALFLIFSYLFLSFLILLG